MKDNALYLEVDEDITSAIDKLNKIKGDSVQIVVPKRSTLLQSVINQKLLKKAAESAGKKLVLVTNDRVATDLAARTGLAVAASLGAEAVLATAKKTVPVLSDDVIEDGDPEPIGPPPEATKPTSSSKDSSKDSGKTAKRAASPVVATRALTDDEPALADDAAASATDKATKPDKEPKVPNFNKLRNRALWLTGLIVIIIGYLVGMYFLSSGSVTLYANGARSDIDTNFTVDTSLTKSDPTTTTVAGQSITTSNSISTTFTPTGSQNVGTKASGSMTVVNNSGTAQTLSAGTRFVAPDGNVFVSTSDVAVPAKTFTASPDGTPIPHPGTATVGVTASQPGDNYNEAGGQAYTIPGLGSQTLIVGKGGQMSGGTTKTVQVVTQTDVDTATAAAVAKDKSAGQTTLKGKVPTDSIALTASLTATPANVVSSPPVGGQGSQATLTMTINYAMLVVNKADYTAMIENIEQKQLGANNQIYDNGIGNADMTAGAVTGTKQSFRFVTTASGGPSFDRVGIANALRGKKYSDATDYATGLPGVVKATVTLSPAWSTGMPHIAKHINVVVTINQN